MVRGEGTSAQVADQLVVAAPAKQRLEPQPVRATILPREDPAEAQLSFAQERIWFLEQINPGDASLNICRAVRLKGELRQDLLELSLREITNRHEILRTTFAINQLQAVRDSKPVPLITASRTPEISLIDLSAVAVNQRKQKVEDLALAEVQQPFDLTLGPLLRVTLFKLGPREHVMLLIAHSIVCDDASLKTLFEEIWSSYGFLVGEGRWTPPPLPIQYADYAAWQREVMRDESIKSSLEFWRKEMHEAPVVTELPTDRPRPPVRTWHGQSIELRLEDQVVDQLRRISADDVSLEILLLAALKVVLARHSRQYDIVVGNKISNRDQAEIRNLVGPFSNHLGLRTSLEGDPTFRELLSRVKCHFVEAYDHRSVPFEKLLEELELQPSLSHSPVFQVSFNFQKDRRVSGEVAGLRFEEFQFDDGTSRFDLMVEAIERPTQLDCRFRFSTDLFDHATIARLATHFSTVLEGIVSNPDQRVSALPLLAPSERRQILVDWNNTQTTLGEPSSICRLFEAQADLTPDETAVVFESEELTYRQLNRRANQLAHYLKRRGVGPEVLVGICVERSLEMVVGLLGVLKAGGAYVPLDPGYPPERLRFMLEDAGVRLVLTQQPLLKLTEGATEVACLDSDWEAIRLEREENPESTTASENLAYVIYTSGSTGRPKGVMISHGAISNHMLWMQRAFPLTKADRVLQKTPFSFDASVWEFYAPLLAGAQLVMAQPNGHQDSAYLVKVIAEQKITILQVVPSMLQLLLAEPGLERCDCLRRVFCGGEALTFELREQFFRRLSEAELHNLYGPTEATIDATSWSCERDSNKGVVPIGRPIAKTKLYVLDRHGTPVPVGIAGELHIGGAGLARGYLNRSEITANAFVPDPFSAEGGGRLYKTGDLVRYLADGNIEYLGRIDNQVKVRGFRIELGEIEAVLKVHDSVQNVAVVARHGRLLAYVVVSPENRTDLASLWSELRGFIKRNLPEYMSPAIFVALDALPLTPNGKVDRRALPLPDESRPDLEEPYVDPRDPLEERLAMLWRNVLQLKSIGIRDNFFELGGNSLLAARLFAQIANSFGKHLPLATLFQFPTIEQLANSLRDGETSKPWSSLVNIQPEGSKPPLFCVHAAGANVLIYRPLSRHLGNDQPVYALQAQGLDGRASPLTRVEDMAALYIKEMRALQPEGPYHLLGASFGGLVVFEMAHQLLAQNQQVGLLAMLNTNCPVYSLPKRIRCHAGHLMEMGLRSYTTGLIQAVKHRLNRKVSQANNGSGKTKALDPEIEKLLANDSGVDETLIRTVMSILAAEEQYKPARPVYPGRITLFWARDAKRGFEDNRLAWRKIAAGGFDLHVVPGTHTTMREEPNVEELVAKLKPCLEKASLQKLD